MWNHLQYTDQIKAMEKIYDLMEQQSDETTRVALNAALMELELWSNASIESINAIVHNNEPVVDEEDKESVPKTYIH